MLLEYILGLLIVLSFDMKRICCHISLLLLITSLCACEKTGLDKTFMKPGLVYDLTVEGGINTLGNNQYIRLTKPSLDPAIEPTPISKASVVVNDGRSDIVFKESSAGIYVGVTKGDPNYNEAYRLTIKYNNVVYTAVDTLRQVVNIVDDFLPLSTKSPTDSTVTVTIPKHTFGYLNANKWFITYREAKVTNPQPIWSPSKFDQSAYYSYTHLLGSPNSLYPLNNLKRDFTINQRDFVIIYKMSLSDAYAKYLYAVFMETDWSGLFSGVPVNAKGNVSGNAQGYFHAIDVVLSSYRAKELL
jgi:hypothetical protein